MTGTITKKTILTEIACLIAGTISLGAAELYHNYWTTAIAGGWKYDTSSAPGAYTTLDYQENKASASLLAATGGLLTIKTDKYTFSTNKAGNTISTLNKNSEGWKLLSKTLHIDPAKIQTSAADWFSGTAALDVGATNTIEISKLHPGYKYRIAFWFSTSAGWGDGCKTTISLESDNVTWNKIGYGYMSARNSTWNTVATLDDVVLGGNNSDSLFAGIYAEFTCENITEEPFFSDITLRLENGKLAFTPIHAVSLQMVAIPEPSTFTGLTGIGALCLARRQRRKRKTSETL